MTPFSSSLRIRSNTAEGARSTCRAISAFEVLAFDWRIFRIMPSIVSIILKSYNKSDESSMPDNSPNNYSHYGYTPLHGRPPLFPARGGRTRAGGADSGSLEHARRPL